MSAGSKPSPPAEQQVAPIKLRPIPIQEGLTAGKNRADLVAPFAVTLPDDGKWYEISLIDVDTDAVALAMFVAPGHVFETKAPLGTYKVRYTSGERWYGRKKRFLSDVYEAQDEFSFRSESDAYVGHKLKLIKQRDGNLRFRTVSSDRCQIYDAEPCVLEP